MACGSEAASRHRAGLGNRHCTALHCIELYNVARVSPCFVGGALGVTTPSLRRVLRHWSSHGAACQPLVPRGVAAHAVGGAAPAAARPDGIPHPAWCVCEAAQGHVARR
jgi:hypothetical protein